MDAAPPFKIFDLAVIFLLQNVDLRLSELLLQNLNGGHVGLKLLIVAVLDLILQVLNEQVQRDIAIGCTAAMVSIKLTFVSTSSSFLDVIERHGLEKTLGDGLEMNQRGPL